jgi:alcohol dehydrogenase
LRLRAWWTPAFAKTFGARRRRDYLTQQEADKEEGTMMKAFVVDRYGRKNGVRAGDMPAPELREDDVMIQIHAAGVNPLDSKIRDGAFKLILPYRLPLILGNDLAGVVARVGSRVRRFRPGDEVYARPPKDRIGTFAEFIAIKEDAVALKPKALSMEEAASIPLVGLTAWQALVERGQLKKGQKVLVHAGSGGVGTFAIQLAKHLGAIVATTASAPNAGLMKQLGADIVIDYRKDDFAATLKDFDVVLDTQGGNTLERSLRVLRPGGKLIGIAGPPDPDFAAQIGASWFLKTAMRFLSYRIRKAAKRRDVNYSFLFMRADGDQLGQIASLVEAGAIRPVIDRVFAFESTREALAYVETGRAKGKVVIRIR